MTSSETAESLRICELFALLGEEEVEMVVASLGTGCQVEAYEAGESIFGRGEHSARLYVVADGQLSILTIRDAYIGGQNL